MTQEQHRENQGNSGAPGRENHPSPPSTETEDPRRTGRTAPDGRTGGGGAEPSRRLPWWRRYGPETLVGAIVVAVVGTVVSVGVGALVNGGTDPAPEDNRPTPAVSVRAVAKPTCAGEVCHGLDPRTTHCDADALTVKEEWKDVMRLELRYSARCSTVWGKLTGAGQGDTVTVSSSPTRLHRAAVESGRTKYTPMLAVDVRSGGQELSLQAVAVAVNGYPEQQIPRGHELRISAGPGDLRP